MTPELSPELRDAVQATGGTGPLRLIDPETSTAYVLVRADLYQPVTSPEDELTDTYGAQLEAAMRAGWGDPEMDVYDHYEENRRKLLP
jgi:hypothetical protein